MTPHDPTFDSLELAPWPIFADDELQAVQHVLVSGNVNYWTGEEGRKFEAELEKYLSVPMTLTVANGTLALEAALRALQIGPDDDVVVTPRSYFASVGAVLSVGARPVFADVDSDSQNLTAQSIESVLTPATRAILPVHLAGWPCDMREIGALAEAHDLLVVEDCAQALGATWDGVPAGAFGHAAAFSFCQDKLITAGGEGGAVSSRCEEVIDRIWSYRENGKSRRAWLHHQSENRFAYIRDEIGSNWRMSEMQSAIGRRQLQKLESWLAIRRQHARRYTSELAKSAGLRLAIPSKSAGHAYYQYYAFVKPEKLRRGWSRDRILCELCKHGVPAIAGACAEIYREPVIRDMGLAPAQPLTVAKNLGETSLVLPVYPTLSTEHVDQIIERVDHVLQAATHN